MTPRQLHKLVVKIEWKVLEERACVGVWPPSPLPTVLELTTPQLPPPSVHMSQGAPLTWLQWPQANQSTQLKGPQVLI